MLGFIEGTHLLSYADGAGSTTTLAAPPAKQRFVQITGRFSVPQKYESMYRRAMTGKSKRKDAIRVNCLMCMGWDAAEVNRCTAPHCPLYPYRHGEAEQQESADSPTPVQRDHSSIQAA